jgi:hypothetical protein
LRPMPHFWGEMPSKYGLHFFLRKAARLRSFAWLTIRMPWQIVILIWPLAYVPA